MTAAPADRRIDTLFRARAAETPDAVALWFDGRPTSYAELDRLSDELVVRLRVAGAGRGGTVGVCLPRSPAMVAALLAVLKSGAAYTMLDPAYPAGRLRSIMDAASISVAFTGPATGAVDWTGVTLVTVTGAEEPGGPGASPAAPETNGVGSDPGGPAAGTPPPGTDLDPACVIFTSGSTGRPKGVLAPHRAIVATLTGQDYAAFGPGEIWLQSAPVSWDAFATELLGPLLSGGTCVLQPGQHPDPATMAELIVRHRVTVLKASASLFNYMLDEYPRLFGQLRAAMTGGEPASPTHAARVLRTFSQVRLINGYGPAESMGYTTTHDIVSGDVIGAVPIGQPIHGKAVHLLDRALTPVTDSEVGEVYLAGSGLALGYVGQPALTAERFVANPFGRPGDRMYRTGDLARRRADGALEFQGRADEQVKIRGFRVEPDEVGVALAGHPRVGQAAVVVRTEPSGEKRLVGYVVGDVTPEELAGYTADRLPDFMVPSAFVVLPELLRTPNGKLDRAALPPPPTPDAPGGRPFANAHEKLIGELFAEVLGVARVGADSHFFRLGGHSLLAAKLLARLRERLPTNLTMRAVFEAPTPAAFAERLAARPATAVVGSIPRRTPGLPVPLAPVQTRLWFADRLAPGTAEYVVPVVLRLRGDLDVAVLATALGRLRERHAVLRTRFVERGLGVEQLVDDPQPLPVPVEELPPGSVGAFVAARSTEPMDLSTGPVFRATVGRVAPDDRVLVLCVHHIVVDDWSLAVLAADLGHLYRAVRDGEPSGLGELELEYADVAAWQHDRDDRAGLSYWRSRLRGMPHVLELPVDRPRPKERDLRGGQVDVKLDAGLVARLTEFGHRCGASLFMTLLAGFELLVSRYTGERDFAVGVPLAGRDHPATEPLVGFFVNLLVMRADLTDDPTFTELVNRVRATALAGYEHQDVPFDRVVEAIQPERDLSRNPVVQVVFALQTAATARWQLDGLAVERLRSHTRTSKFDLFMALEETSDGGLTGTVEYPVALFDTATVERLTRHYALLLAALVEEPDRPVRHLSALDSAERRWWDQVVNGTAHDLGDLTVPALVAQQAAVRPDAVAVECGTDRISYAELDRRANQIAHHLRSRGVGAETPVAVCFERSIELPAVILGVLKAGACYVPLDADYPAERIAFMLRDTGASLVLAPRDLMARLPVAAPTWEDLCAAIAGMPTHEPAGVLHPDQLAYVMYTSGSTGRPKGVEVSHRSIVRLVHGVDYTELGPEVVLLLQAPLSFDASTFELWGALCTGGRLAVLPPGVPTADGLQQAIERHRVTTMWLTAGLFHVVVDEQPTALRGLRHLLAGGDVVSPAHVRALAEATGVPVGNGYGPTECTTFTCVQPTVSPDGGPAPIGPPIGNTRVYVVDRHLNRVPVGAIGELMVAGPGLARGYRNRPALTAERFVANPFEPNGRMYRTGDLVRVRTDGVLEYVGRVDRQVKIRGYRIEPGEIENALAAYPGVERVVVTVREDVPGDRQLVAYVVATSELTAGDLGAHARRVLPGYLVPNAFLRLDAFPLDANGKVDRSALPAPDRSTGDRPYRAPATSTEIAVAEVWSEVLGVERPGADDSFFDLGGHSLAAARAVMRLSSGLRREVGVRLLFREPVLAGFAATIDARTGQDAPVVAIPVCPGDAPLSPAQPGIWLADCLNPGSAEYLIVRAIHLRGPLDPQSLAAALTSVTTRHEPLRTSYPERQGRPVQVVAPPADVPLPVTEVAGVGEFVRRQAAIPIDIESGPPFRAALGRIGRDEHVLVLCLHHIAVDGMSILLLAEELAQVYPAVREGQPAGLPALPTRYRDWAAWQADRASDLEYWRKALDGMPHSVALPVDRPHPAERDLTGALVASILPADVVRRAADLAHERGTTRFAVLLAVFQVLLHEMTGMPDLGIGMPVAGRNHPATERLLGHFVNTVVLRSRLSGMETFGQFLADSQANLLEVLEHQDVPFDRVVQAVRPTRDLSRNPLVQVVFTMAEGITETWRLPGLSVETIPAHSLTSKFDLTLAVRGGADGELTVGWEYPSALFEQVTVRGFADRYATLMARLTSTPDAPL